MRHVNGCRGSARSSREAGLPALFKMVEFGAKPRSCRSRSLAIGYGDGAMVVVHSICNSRSDSDGVGGTISAGPICGAEGGAADRRWHLPRDPPTRDRLAARPLVGFRVQVAFVRGPPDLPRQAPLEIDGDTLRFAPCSWERRRDVPRLRRPAAGGLRTSTAHRRAPAPAHYRSTVTRVGGVRDSAPRPGRLPPARGVRLAATPRALAGTAAGRRASRTRPAPGTA